MKMLAIALLVSSAVLQANAAGLCSENAVDRAVLTERVDKAVERFNVGEATRGEVAITRAAVTQYDLCVNAKNTDAFSAYVVTLKERFEDLKQQLAVGGASKLDALPLLGEIQSTKSSCPDRIKAFEELFEVGDVTRADIDATKSACGFVSKL